MLVLLACWQPTPYIPPEPPEVAIEAMAARPENAPEADQGTPEYPAPEDPAPEDPAPEDPAPEETPTPAPIKPYRATLASAPAMLVDDVGKPVMALDKPDVKLEVRADEGYRKRVICLSCSPQAEGWLQEKLVIRQE